MSKPATKNDAQEHAALTLINEGAGYGVQDYCGPSHYAADPELALLWANAGMALGKLETYLVKNAPEHCYDELQDRTADVERLEGEFMELLEDKGGGGNFVMDTDG